jgi:hypothetical protein
MSIEGEWKGFYRYAQAGPGAEDCPFTASIACDGRRISGSTVDHRDRITTLPYRQIYEAFGGTMSPEDLASAREFLREYPDAEWRSELPLEAEIHGEIRLSRVMFAKRYLGTERGTWIFGDREVVDYDVQGHHVFYEGRLSSDESAIEGTWLIRKPGLLGQFQEPASTGTFTMSKDR